MKNKWLIPLLLFFLGGCFSSPETVKFSEIPYFLDDFRSPPEWDKGHLIMWTLEYEKGTLYFLGSTHMASADFYPLDQEITRAYDECENLVVEVDITSIDESAITSWLFSRGTFQGEETIYDHLSPEETGALEADLKEYGLSLKRFKKMKPFFLEMTLVSLIVEKAGYKAEYGIDLHFLNAAKKQGKAVHSLETMEEQLSVLSDGSLRSQVASLNNTMTQIEEVDQYISFLMEAWKNGDLAAVESIALEGMDEPEMQESYNSLYVQRNIRWVEKIEEYMARGGHWFIVGGSGHFVGDYSVIRLLRMKGYEVKRL